MTSITSGSQFSKDTYSDFNDFATRSLHSSSSKKKKQHDRGVKISEFFLTVMASTVSVNSFDRFSFYDDDTIYHFIFNIIFIVMPMAYTQLIMGQYTQLGVMGLRSMCPIMHGLGFNLIIATVFQAIHFTHLLCDCFMFLLCSIQTNLPWLMCPKDNSLGCWDQRINCKSNCVSSDVQLSTVRYYLHVYWNLSKKNINDEEIHFQIPNFQRLFTLLIVCFIFCAVMIFGQLRYRKIMKNIVILAFVGYGIIVCILITRVHGFSSIQSVFKFEPVDILRYDIWCNSISNIITLFSLGRGILFVYGSKLPVNAPTGVLTICYVGLSCALCFLSAIMINVGIGVLSADAKVLFNSETRKKILYNIDMVPAMFSIIPQCTTYFPSSQVFSFIYFISIFGLGINNQIANFLFFEKSILDSYPRMLKYRNHVYAVMFVCLYILMSMISSGKLFFFRIIIAQNTRILELINFWLLSICVYYIYTVVKFSDDIHFMLGQQPVLFWKICWVLMPIIIAFPIYHVVTTIIYNTNQHRLLHMLILSIMACPFTAILVYEFTLHLKTHNLIGLILPRERWGPSNPEERHMRLLFNPRKETKSRRRYEICKHKCLINIKLLNKFLQDEDRVRNEHDEIANDYTEDYQFQGEEEENDVHNNLLDFDIENEE